MDTSELNCLCRCNQSKWRIRSRDIGGKQHGQNEIFFWLKSPGEQNQFAQYLLTWVDVRPDSQLEWECSFQSRKKISILCQWTLSMLKLKSFSLKVCLIQANASKFSYLPIFLVPRKMGVTVKYVLNVIRAQRFRIWVENETMQRMHCLAHICKYYHIGQ